MMQVKFGTDGIRGRYPLELNNRIAFKLGQSLSKALNTTRLVIGMDTRESSPELLYNVISGARSAGIDVMNAGIVSTPLISLYSREKQVTGVMITASHNPYHDNGIKVFNNGEKLRYEQEKAIEHYIQNNHEFTVAKIGELYSGEAVLDTYLDLIDKLNLYQTDLKVGLDSANGANYLIALGVFREITETLEQIG
ncbi:MAG: phosphoglucosamine mutase, partial [Candidatus Izimaplasma sp.]|nr:phosphoglucosamine mutase [Candidatus Izimaplasma bacterium]